VLAERGALAGASDHGTTKALYARDPDGLEFEVSWLVPAALLTDDVTMTTAPLDLDAELARYGAQTPGGIGISVPPNPVHSRAIELPVVDVGRLGEDRRSSPPTGRPGVAAARRGRRDASGQPATAGTARSRPASACSDSRSAADPGAVRAGGPLDVHQHVLDPLAQGPAGGR
jgi:hypothetical protein